MFLQYCGLSLERPSDLGATIRFSMIWGKWPMLRGGGQDRWNKSNRAEGSWLCHTVWWTQDHIWGPHLGSTFRIRAESLVLWSCALFLNSLNLSWLIHNREILGSYYYQRLILPWKKKKSNYQMKDQYFIVKIENVCYRSSHSGSVVTNPTSIHEVVGLIPDPTQWVKDAALLWLWCRLVAKAPIWLLAWELPYAAGVALKKFFF